MKAVILAGGKGSRLQPLTNTLPKPLITVLDQPIIVNTIELLKKNQITDIFITLHYLGELIQRYLGDGSRYGVNISYFYETNPLGTAGCIQKIREFLGDSSFMVISGDTMTELDLDNFISQHLKRNCVCSIALKERDYPTEYGTVIIDDSSFVKSFLEKPSWDEVKSKLVNTGIYIFNPGIFNYLSDKKLPLDWSYDVFPRLLQAKQKIYALSMEEYWEDIGNIERYRAANLYALEQLALGKLNRKSIVELRDGIYVGEGCHIANSVKMQAPVYLGDGCIISDSVEIHANTIACSGVNINSHSKIKSSILGQDCYIGKNNRINENAILCNNLKLLDGCVVNNDVVIGAYSMLSNNVVVNNNVKISNNQIISENKYLNEDITKSARDNSISFLNYYQIQGLTNLEITAETALRLALAISAALPASSKVTIARDNSKSARMLKRAIVSGIVSNSIKVIDLEESTVPVLRVSANSSMSNISIFVGTRDHEKFTQIYVYGEAAELITYELSRKIENNFLLRNFKYSSPEHVGDIAYRVHATDYYLESFSHIGSPIEQRYGKRLKISILLRGTRISELVNRICSSLPCEFIMHLVSPQESREKLLQKLSNVVLESKSDFGVIFDGHGEKLYIVDNHSELLSEFEMNKLLIELYKLNKIYGTVLLPTWYTDYFAEMSQDIRIERLKDRELFIASGKKSKVLHQVTPNSLYIFPGNSRFADALLHFYRLVSLLSPLRDIDINSLKKLDKIHILYKHIAVDESKRPFFLDEINAFLINKSSDGFFDRDYGLRASFDRRDWLFAKLDRETSSAHIWIEGRDEKAVQNSMKQLKEHLKQSKLIREQRNVG